MATSGKHSAITHPEESDGLWLCWQFLRRSFPAISAVRHSWKASALALGSATVMEGQVDGGR